MKEKDTKPKETRSELENYLFRLQRMQENGFDMANLPDEAFERLKELVEQEDAEKLSKLRLDLQELFGTQIDLSSS